MGYGHLLMVDGQRGVFKKAGVRARSFFYLQQACSSPNRRAAGGQGLPAGSHDGCALLRRLARSRFIIYHHSEAKRTRLQKKPAGRGEA